MNDVAYDCTLLDDGTMDTVVEVFDPITEQTREWRYSDTSDYRDPQSGALDEETFFAEVVIPDAECEDWGE